jgi:hypothetical protein
MKRKGDEPAVTAAPMLGRGEIGVGTASASLSGLGWAFVAAAVLWEPFAIDLSRCAGWGWEKGGFFFAWGLGILAFGVCLRIRSERRAISGLFLGVNILVVGVLALVVGTR